MVNRTRGRVLKSSKYNNLAEEIKKFNCLIFTDFHGLKNDEIDELRKNMYSLRTKYRVLKNTIASIILKEKKMDILTEQLKGPTAVAVLRSQDDFVSVVKTLVQFSKEHKNFKIRSGFYNNKLLSTKEINEISLIPDKKILYEKLTGILRTSLINIVNVLSMPVKKMVYQISQIKKVEG